MRANRRLSVFFICLLWLSGIKAADAIQNPVPKLVLIGEAKLSVLFWDIYDAQLYNAKGVYSLDELPLALEITYLREITRNDLLDATKKELRKQSNRLTDQQIDYALSTFADYWPDINPGQTLTFVLTERGGQFFFNNQFIGEVDSFPIAKAFIDIWLAEDSSYPKLSAKLRGGG